LKTIGVVLAGGLSSRMRLDKTQLIWQGSTLLEHAQSLLIEAGCETVLVSNNSDSQFIADRYPNSGPLAGIDACLDYIIHHFADAEAMLIMPVDMPLMSQELLANINQQAIKGNAVYYSAGRFPLVLPVSEQLSILLTASLKKSNSGKGVSIKYLLGKLPCQELIIDQDQQRAFYNCNTPEEWQNLISK